MARDDNTDYESDVSLPNSSRGIGAGVSTRNDLGCCGQPMASLLSESGADLGPEAGKLWDPNQGELRGLDGSSPGFLQGIAAMIIMTVMYPARSARFDLLKCVCFLAKRITRWGLDCDHRLHR